MSLSKEELGKQLGFSEYIDDSSSALHRAIQTIVAVGDNYSDEGWAPCLFHYEFPQNWAPKFKPDSGVELDVQTGPNPVARVIRLVSVLVLREDQAVALNYIASNKVPRDVLLGGDAQHTLADFQLHVSHVVATPMDTWDFDEVYPFIATQLNEMYEQGRRVVPMVNGVSAIDRAVSDDLHFRTVGDASVGSVNPESTDAVTNPAVPDSHAKVGITSGTPLKTRKLIEEVASSMVNNTTARETSMAVEYRAEVEEFCHTMEALTVMMSMAQYQTAKAITVNSAEDVDMYCRALTAVGNYNLSFQLEQRMDEFCRQHRIPAEEFVPLLYGSTAFIEAAREMRGLLFTGLRGIIDVDKDTPYETVEDIHAILALTDPPAAPVVPPNIDSLIDQTHNWG